MGGDAAVTDTHYEDVAKGYEGAFFYESGAYQDWLLAQLVDRLELGGAAGRDLRVVDVGGGTGNFTAALAAAALLSRPVLCVDNSREMLAVAAGRAGIVPREQDAAAFAASTDADATGYDRVLLKEIVHHVAADDVGPMYAGLARQLAPGGLCVTVTRPQEVDYPLWPAAREVWRKAQPPAERLAAQAAAAGLDVAVHEAVYSATLPKQRWFAMVRARFWSTFAAFDARGIEDGVAYLEAQHADTDCVTFNDRLIIIVGRKPADLSAAFARDGVLPRCAVLSAAEAEAAAAYADFRRYEAACGGAVSGDARFKAHLQLPWLWDVIHHPRLTSAVSTALGSPHIACWSSDVFVKEAGTGALTTWHQDSTYAGMHPPDGLTAWLALTPATAESGALRLLRGSHARGQLPHARGRGGPDNLLLAGQEAIGVDDADASGDVITAELAPGEASLHHLLTVHSSGPNRAQHRRVGLAIRYITAAVTQARQPRDSVAVVCGDAAAFADRYALETPPAAEMDDAGRAAHARAVAVVHPDSATPQV